MTEKRVQFYGRRKGRPLLKTHQDLMAQLMPKVGINLSESLIDPPSLLDRKEAWLEIGFGGGEHLAYQAENNPLVGLIGAEAFINGVASLLRHIEEKSLANIRVYEGDARLLLSKIKPESLSRIFILFPDPWPKKKHYKRRLISSETLIILHQLLCKNGVLRIASDEPSYVQWILAHFEKSPLFSMPPGDKDAWIIPPEDWIQTRYEKKAHQEGRTPFYLDFTKI